MRKTILKDEERCEARVFSDSGFLSPRCMNRWKVEHEGKRYCGQHDPEVIAARRAAKDAEWDAKWKAEREKTAAQHHKLGTWGMVAKALLMASAHISEQEANSMDAQDLADLDEALAAAEKGLEP